MRIISDFKDYYDWAQSLGFDPKIVYVRKTETFESEEGFGFPSTSEWLPVSLRGVLGETFERPRKAPNIFVRRTARYRWEDLNLPLTTKLIGFCGYLYPAIHIDGHTYYETQRMCAGLSNAFLRQFRTTRGIIEESLSSSSKLPAFRWKNTIRHESWNQLTKECDGNRQDDLFVELGLPAFKVERRRIDKKSWRMRCILNPQLRLDDFQKVKDLATAFQEIAMYVGDRLAHQPDPVPRVSDEILRDEKGFDEWSFRRHREEDKKRLKKKSRTS